RCLLYWIEGKKMTPPLIEIYEDNNHLFISGGHHRLAICRAKVEKQVPFLTKPKYKDRMSEILKSANWK
ncbi:MAG: hypothetical protein P4L45_01940, partial [Ignavibacteriaceae bacterium]|nr:hypothetical protein [Ignavibacteriaceae bacterium]